MSDADLVNRIESCLLDADPDLAHMWRECVRKWGVRSAAAVGCLVALVGGAWVPMDGSAVLTRVDEDGGFVGIGDPMGWAFEADEDSLEEAAVLALEAAVP